MSATNPFHVTISSMRAKNFSHRVTFFFFVNSKAEKLI